MLPLLPFEKISKKAGVKRISRDAIEEMRDIIEEIANEIADDAVRLSRHAERRTVKARDIEFVIKSKHR